MNKNKRFREGEWPEEWIYTKDQARAAVTHLGLDVEDFDDMVNRLWSINGYEEEPEITSRLAFEDLQHCYIQDIDNALGIRAILKLTPVQWIDFVYSKRK